MSFFELLWTLKAVGLIAGDGRIGLLKPDYSSAKGLFGSAGVVIFIGGCSKEKP